MKMRIEVIRSGMALLAVLALVPAAGWAFGGQGGGRPQGPPQAAIDACQGKKAGDAVQFQSRRGGMLQATCQEQGGQLVAVPEGGRRGPGGSGGGR